MAESARPPCTYNVHPSVAYVQTVLANIQGKTGRTVQEWSDLLREAAPLDTRAWLKAQGLGTNQAAFVVQRASASPNHAFDDTPEGYLAAAPIYVDRQYSGKKAGQRPLFEHIVAMTRGLGLDVKVCPCATIVPFYRHHVFAEVKPLVARLDLGLALGDPAAVKDPGGRLRDTGGFKKKDRITHRLEIASEADLGAALPWLRQAYERDTAGSGTP